MFSLDVSVVGNYIPHYLFYFELVVISLVLTYVCMDGFEFLLPM